MRLYSLVLVKGLEGRAIKKLFVHGFNYCHLREEGWYHNLRNSVPLFNRYQKQMG